MELEKQNKTKLKAKRKKEITNIRAELDKMENKKIIEKISKTKVGSLKILATLINIIKDIYENSQLTSCSMTKNSEFFL